MISANVVTTGTDASPAGEHGNADRAISASPSTGRVLSTRRFAPLMTIGLSTWTAAQPALLLHPRRAAHTPIGGT